MMKLPAAVALAAMIACTAPAVAAEEAAGIDPGLSALHARLTAVSELAFNCEESLHRFGKKALETEGCSRFIERFNELWGDRETLQRMVHSFTRAAEHGRMPCDARCADMLRRCEELRIAITYILDYAEFTAQN